MTDNEKRAHDIAITMLSAKMHATNTLPAHDALNIINQADFTELYLSFYNTELKKLN